MIGLGFKPLLLEVRLERDGAFVGGIESPEQGWPDGTAIELRFTSAGSSAVWPAAISGRLASWNVPAVEVNELLQTRPRLARLFYAAGASSPLVWARGPVVTQ